MRNVSSSNRSFARLAAAGLLLVIATSFGCDKSSVPDLSGPSRLSLTSVFPNSGSTTTALPVRIFGTGFKSGATLMVGNVQIDSTLLNDRILSATMPIHDAGVVDIVVTNPGGESARLPAAFTFGDLSLTASTALVTAGGSLSVSWVAPGFRREADWVGFFKVGEPTANYESRWWRYTYGAASDTLTLTAPEEPGQYEFRYLLDDGFVEAAHTAPVTVTAGALNSRSR